MNAKLILSMVLGAMLFASCASDEINVPDDELANISFTAGLDRAMTRSAYDNGAKLKTMNVHIYDANVNGTKEIDVANATYLTSEEVELKGLTADVELSLSRGKTYVVVFWAQVEGAPYTFDATAGAVTANLSGDAQDLKRDVFYAREEITVTGDKNEPITLRRPLAQINIGDNSASGSIATAGFKITGAPNVLDVRTGVASGSAEYTIAPQVVMTGENFTIAEKEYKWLATTSVFAPAEVQNVGVEWTTDVNKVTKTLKTFANVPIQRNYRTNIAGTLVSKIEWGLTGEYTIEAQQPDVYRYSGGTMPAFTVTAYVTDASGNKRSVSDEDLIVRYSEDGATWSATAPIWLHSFTSVHNAATYTRTYTAKVRALYALSETSAHTATLKATAPKGTKDAPYNLANANGAATVENTANCYVVNAPGFYSVPLVYGNAIKNGSDNKSAYHTANTTARGTYSTRIPNEVLSDLINHAGAAITTPYIKDHADLTTDDVTAEIIWQDSPDLVMDATYKSDENGGNISFEVGKEHIRQGNAVIAIKKGSTVLWSWHIWVTDEKVNSTVSITNKEDKTFGIMPVYLGWCDANTVEYDPNRTCMVKFIAGNKSAEITISQTGATITTGGNTPFYQWGRKDPLLPTDGIDASVGNKIWYDKDSKPITTGLISVVWGGSNTDFGIPAIKISILNPGSILKTGSSDPHGFINLWNIDYAEAIDYSDVNNREVIYAKSVDVVKTVYDPCPVGFKVPSCNPFTGFLGARTLSDNYINGIWNMTEFGAYMNTVPGSSENPIFFKGAGYRNNSAEIRNYNQAFCWLAVPFDGGGLKANGSKMYSRGSSLSIWGSKGTMRLAQSHSREVCLPVRPCAE